MNRDSAVKKIIYNFEAILEAHNDEKNKNIEIRAKYAEKQKEIIELKRINSQLTELLNVDNEQRIKQEEEKLKNELNKLQEELKQK